MELGVLVGVQGAGKSTFARAVLGEEWVVVSKDDFPNARNRQRRQMRLVEEALAAGRDVVVDNINPGPEEWAPLIAAGRAYGATVAGYWFPPDVAGARERNARREGRRRVPDVGFYATLGRLRRPAVADGFDRLYQVTFDGNGGFVVERMDGR